MSKTTQPATPVLKQTELPLQTHLSTEATRPQCLISWDPLAEGEFDPNSRYPDMKLGVLEKNAPDTRERLHEFLHDRINHAIRRWQKLPDKPESVAEAIRIKDSCLQAICTAHAMVMRPGMDRSALSHATALCANAIRTVTVLCNHVIDWPDSVKSDSVTAKREREFGLSRYFAGMRSYTPAQLNRRMLPFGCGRKLTPIRRETPDDPRLLANVFAGSPEAVIEGYQAVLVRLRKPIGNAYTEEEDADGITESSRDYRVGA